MAVERPKTSSPAFTPGVPTRTLGVGRAIAPGKTGGWIRPGRRGHDSAAWAYAGSCSVREPVAGRCGVSVPPRTRYLRAQRPRPRWDYSRRSRREPTGCAIGLPRVSATVASLPHRRKWIGRAVTPSSCAGPGVLEAQGGASRREGPSVSGLVSAIEIPGGLPCRQQTYGTCSESGRDSRPPGRSGGSRCIR